MAAGRLVSAVLFACLLLLRLPTWSWAHRCAGQRFFLTTLAINVPFVSDELSFLVRHIKEPGKGNEPPTVSTEINAEYSKRITTRLGISLGGAFQHLAPDGGPTAHGLQNLQVGAAYQLLVSARSEALVKVGLTAEVGGTGSYALGADTFSTLSPGLFFGKGFGDVAASVPFLRPLALTGALTVHIPTRGRPSRHRSIPSQGI